MTGSNTGTSAAAAASSGGGANNSQTQTNQQRQQRNNNSSNNTSSTRNTTNKSRQTLTSSEILKKIVNNEPIFHLAHNSPNDFNSLLKETSDAVTLMSNLNHPAHFGAAIKDLKEIIPVEPTKPKREAIKADATEEDKEDANTFFKAEVAIWQTDRSAHKKKVDQLNADRHVVYVKLEKLMSDEVRMEVQRDDDYASVNGNPIGLLKIIRKVCCGYSNDKGDPYFLNIQQHHQLVTDFQKNNETLDTYARKTTSNVNAFHDAGGSISLQPGLLKATAEEMFPGVLPKDASGQTKLTIVLEGLTLEESQQVMDKTAERHLAALLFFNLNNKVYGDLKRNVQNNHTLGADDAYPTTKARVIDLCTRFKTGNSNSNTTTRDRRGGDGGSGSGTGSSGGSGTRTDGLQYAQVSDTAVVVETPTSGPTTEVCIHCGENDHLASACPQLTPERRAQLLAQNKSSAKDLGTILDTCSEFTTAPASELTNIRDAPATLEFSTSTGAGTRTQIGDLDPFNNNSTITAWVTPSSASPSTIKATILALKDVTKHHRVTYDSEANDGAFLVHTPEGVHYLRPCTHTGFPRLDTTTSSSSTQLLQANSTTTDSATIPTIEANYDNFTAHDIKRATLARNIQTMTNLSEKDFKHLVSTNKLRDCDVTTREITNARLNFGRDLPGLRGKTRRRKPKRVEVNLVEIPRDFMNLYKNITLTADVFFVNGIPFFLTLSRQVRFLTVQHVPHRSAGELANSLKLTLLKYGAAGFLVQVVLMDGEFDKICEKMPNVIINTTAAREHVHEIERMIQTVKGKVRGMRNAFPRKLRFCPLPNLFWKSMVYNAIFWLNAFPAAEGVGISTDYSPRELVLRQPVSINTQCTVILGTYCEVHHEPEPKDTNNMEPRTTEGIAMGPVGNIQGTQKFYDLHSSRIIKRKV